MKMIMSTFSIKLDFNMRPHSLYQTYTTTFYVCRLIDQILSFSSINWNQLEVKELVLKNSSTRLAKIFNDILRVNPDCKLIQFISENSNLMWISTIAKFFHVYTRKF